jgi:hypothetical protein
VFLIQVITAVLVKDSALYVECNNGQSPCEASIFDMFRHATQKNVRVNHTDIVPSTSSMPHTVVGKMSKRHAITMSTDNEPGSNDYPVMALNNIERDSKWSTDQLGGSIMDQIWSYLTGSDRFICPKQRMTQPIICPGPSRYFCSGTGSIEGKLCPSSSTVYSLPVPWLRTTSIEPFSDFKATL